LARFGALMVALLFGLIGVLSMRLVWDDYRFGETSPGIGVPQWWYSIWLPVLSIAIMLRALGLFIRRGRDQDAA
ncbi:MAG: TRAP transporter small permease subunit, partial [Burkholderiales bacterium]|nr:TRAP transporter small permease subunit [Burkholderiales bacterium]